MRRLLVLCCVILAGSIISTASSSQLSLTDCYRKALDYNAQRKLQTERLTESNAKVDEYSGQRLPSATVIGSVTHNGDVEKVNLGMSSFSMSPDNSYRYSLQVSQTLFDGHRVANAIEMQRQNLSKTEQDRLKLEHDIAYSVTSAYWSWALAVRVETVAYESMVTSRENAELAKRRYDAGQVSKFDVLRANVQADQFATSWETSKDNRSRASQILTYWIGSVVDSTKTPSDSFRYSSVNVSTDSLLVVAKHTRSEFGQLDYQKHIAELSIRLSKVGYFPILMASGNLTWMNGSDPFDPNKMNRSWAVGAQLSYPLFDGWQTRAKVQETQSALRQTNWLVTDFERSVVNELRNATIGINDAERRLKMQNKYVAQAEDAYRLAREQFNNGQLSTHDVSDAELALSTARLSREQALYDWTMAYVNIRKATGELHNDLLQGNNR